MSLESSALNSLKKPSPRFWPQICVTGNETTLAALVTRISSVLSEDPDVICEARLDYLQLKPESWTEFLNLFRGSFSAQELRRILITIRRQDSGVAAAGGCNWPLKTWFTVLANAASSESFWGVDFDWRKSLTDQKLPKPVHTKIILSWHGEIAQTNSIFSQLLRHCEARGYWMKLAVPVHSPADLLQLARFSKSAMSIRERSSFIAMGAAGRAWRWSLCSGALSYFAANSSLSTAPGQSFWQEILPFRQQGKMPQLYGLIGSDTNNYYGELRWNRLFNYLRWDYRYVALAFTEKENAKIQGRELLVALKIMGLRGVSVTKPFKQFFLPVAINTLKREDRGWKLANTDGIAVVSAITQHLSAEDCRNASIRIFGGGGASQGVISALRNNGFKKPAIQRRKLSGEISLPESPATIWIITWPAALSQSLLETLRQNDSKTADLLPRIIINASLDNNSNSSWEKWCEHHDIAFIGGNIWWSGQARRQFQYWFSQVDRKKLQQQLLQWVPRSKSETLRALAFSWASGRKLNIIDAAIGDDTRHLKNALQQLGTFSGTKALAPKKSSPILLGEGATGFRFLAVLWGVFGEGELLIETTGKLSERNHADLFRVVKIEQIRANLWRTQGSSAQLDQLSAKTTSQVLSAQLIAAAAMIARGVKKEHIFHLGEILISEPYVRMTQSMLMNLGFSFKLDRAEKKLSIFVDKKLALHKFPHAIPIHYDASALPFLDILGWESGLGELSFNIELGEQGDKKFSTLFTDIRQKPHSQKISLRDIPDLAPPLVAAAILWRREMQFINAAQLREKESNRLEALVELARAVGCIAHETSDGLYLDARSHKWRNVDILVKTYGDHRIAMAAGILKLRWPRLCVDNPDCVAKSFPHFWKLLNFFTEIWL